MKYLDQLVKGEYKNIWIYGAGKVGRKLIKDFHFFDIQVNGIVVSKYDGTCIHGTSVVELGDVPSDSGDTMFIITTAEKFHEEIIANLHENGFKNYMIWDEKALCELWRLADYMFEDRRSGKDKCCFILAGYKEFLWENVFERLERFIPEDMDVCIISSGIYKDSLSKLAEKNGWSYLSTKINSVTLVQNVAFAVFDTYQWVYKVDEDMFVTKNAFENLYNTYMEAEDNSGVVPGVVAPLIPVNGYGYKMILQRAKKEKTYESKFGKIIIGGNPNSEIEKNPESAVFMWEECPQIDEMNRMFQLESYHVCAVRFSIGFILMKHELWCSMNGFSVSGNPDMGTDEEELCGYCINNSRPIIVGHNTVVGHFSFGRQTERMKQLLDKKPELFSIRK